jgi:di/tricarboxylate transporter
VAGAIPQDQAFSGFGHPATVVIALVLVVSRALSNSGAIEFVARYLVSSSRALSAHIGVMSVIAAALSAIMNNVAALAVLMPVDIQAAIRAKRSPALSLMPLSFATILGGMITLIGTPPNIIIAEFRSTAMGEPYGMFDFAPVGLACTVAGVLFISLIGWRLIPASRSTDKGAATLFDIGEYVAEVTVPADAPVIGQRVRDLDAAADDNEVTVLGLVRRGKRLPGLARLAEIAAGDVLVIEATPQAIDSFVGALKLKYDRSQKTESTATGEDLLLIEVVVPQGARIEGRSAAGLRLLAHHDVTLLGVFRQGRRFRERVRQLTLNAGDVLLLLGPADYVHEVVSWLGCLPLRERGLQLLQRERALLTVGIFGAAVLTAAMGWLYLPIALGAAVALLVLLNVVPLRQVYDSIEWPVIVLLGSMIPIGMALETSGGTSLIAQGVVAISAGLPPIMILGLLMIVTMTLSDVMNNTATAVIMAPIAIEIAATLGVQADPFLMCVAVAASCAFLTPIGHKNNTLVMGPGGYRFGDYWRMGLPLELLVLAVSLPVIVWVWPF